MLRTPSRTALLKRLARTNAWAGILILVELGVVLFLGLGVLMGKRPLPDPIELVIVFGMVTLPTALALGRIIAQKKLPLSALKENRSIGKFTAAEIQALVRQTEQRLNVKPGSVRVYITREKELNAAAVRVGLGRLFPTLNAIYLNRPALHVLDAKELTAVIAHEIAHNERYYLVWDRYLVLHKVFQLLASLSLGPSVAGFLPFFSEGLIPAVIVGWACESLSARYRLRYSHTLEYLCDDAGGVVAGVEPAIQGELKIARHTEAHSKVLLHALRRKVHDRVELSVQEIFHELEQVLPFENLDQSAVTHELDARLRKIERVRGDFSFKGFLVYLGVLETFEARNELRQELDLLEELHQMPTIPWRPDFENMQKLVDVIMENPETPLFQSRSDLNAACSTHPSTRQRIVYLWKSRAEIDAERFKQP